MEVEGFVCRRMRSRSGRLCVAAFAAVLLPLAQLSITPARAASGSLEFNNQVQSSSTRERETMSTSSADAEAELQTGTALTRKGSFHEAIPHLLAARGRVSREYVATFNLALCYVGTSQFTLAIENLNDLSRSGHDSADVENLLAQAYVGSRQTQEALAALQRAASLSPQNEKLYVFVADACMDHKDYDFGLKVADIGLKNLPQSARLHYERAMFLTQLDRLSEARPQFEETSKLAPGTEIAYLAAAQQQMFAGEIPGAIMAARDGIKKGYENPALLTILGEALVRSGITPGQADFAEAQTALERAVTLRPSEAASQIALGNLYLSGGRLDDAIKHLELARDIDPGTSSVYASLAKAYQRGGNIHQSQEALAILERINREQADRIRSAPGESKLGVAGRGGSSEISASPHP